jgi:hypothetical protein
MGDDHDDHGHDDVQGHFYQSSLMQHTGLNQA